MTATEKIPTVPFAASRLARPFAPAVAEFAIAGSLVHVGGPRTPAPTLGAAARCPPLPSEGRQRDFCSILNRPLATAAVFASLRNSASAGPCRGRPDAPVAEARVLVACYKVSFVQLAQWTIRRRDWFR